MSGEPLAEYPGGHDRALERLKQFGWDHEACVLKAAAIKGLYSTRAWAIWRMSRHLEVVMKHQPEDPVKTVEKIATLPSGDGSPPRTHWSFAWKIGHFFIDRNRIPICDSFSQRMVAYHLGGSRIRDRGNPYGAFLTNLAHLREASRLSATLREWDRYLWLTGQYREWCDDRERARVNSELRSLFGNNDSEIQRLLRVLWPARG